MAIAIIEKVTLFCNDCDRKFGMEARQFIGNPDEVFATFVTDLNYDTRCPHCKQHITFCMPSRTDDMRKRQTKGE